MATTDVAPLMAKGIEKHCMNTLQYVEPMGKQLFHVDTMDGRFRDIQNWVGYGLPRLRLDGEPISTDSIRPSFAMRMVASSYSTGDVIADELISDDQYGMIVKWASAKGALLAQAFTTLEERLMADFFATAGFTASTPVNNSFDGQPLFSTSHPLSASNTGRTVSNRTSVDIDLSMAAMQWSRSVLAQIDDPNGVSLQQSKISKLVVNPNLEDVAWQLTKGQYERGSNNFNENFMKDKGITVVSWPYFRKTGAQSPANSWNAWFVQADQHNLYWSDRAQIEFATDRIANIRSTAFYAHRRLALGASDFRGLAGSTGF